MGNVLRRELEANYRSTAVWAVALSALTYLMMTLFPSIARHNASWDRLISQLPKGVLAGFWMDQLRISDIFGYYGTQIYTLLVLFVAIYGAMLFSAALSREESEATIEFLLARPISRAEIFAGKATAATLLVLGCNAVLFLATWGSFAQFHTLAYPLAPLVWFSVGLALITLVFGFVGLGLSVWLPRPRTLTSLSVGIAFVSYLLGVTSAMSSRMQALRWVSPFQFVGAPTIVQRGSLPPAHLLGLLAVCAVCAGAAYAAYRTKDIVL